MNSLKARVLALQIAFSIALTATEDARAVEFDCHEVDRTSPAHQHVFGALTEQIGIEPVELRYCGHDQYPLWLARWQPFEELDYGGAIWRRYATARCSDGFADFHCVVTNHVVAGNSHVVVDLPPCDTPLPTVAALHAAAGQLYPGYELKEVDFMAVLDGGAWTASDYGYKVWLIEPPKYDGGLIRQFVQSCRAGMCTWRDNGDQGTWSAGSPDLAALRRTRNDPLIEYLEP